MTPREKRLVAVAAVIALGWGGTTFGVRPLIGARERTRTDIETARFELAQARRTLTRSERVERELALATAEGRRMRSRLLPGEGVSIAGAELGKLVNSAAKQANVELKSNKAKDPVIVGNLTNIPTEIHLELTVESLVDLLYRLETHQRSLQVSAISIRQRNRRTPDEKLDVRMTVHGFTASPDPEQGS